MRRCYECSERHDEEQGKASKREAERLPGRSTEQGTPRLRVERNEEGEGSQKGEGAQKAVTMFASLLRQAVRLAHVGEAAEVGSKTVIMQILKDHGPCSKHVIWQHAEEAGVKSKRHMKQMLLYLKNNKELEVSAIPKVKEARENEDFAHGGKKKKKKGQGSHSPPPADKEFVYALRQSPVS